MDRIKALEKYLNEEHSYQDQFKDAIVQIIRDLSDDAIKGKVPKQFCTEETLNTIQDTFGLTVKKCYKSDIIKKSKYLLDYFYDAVREQEIQDRKTEKEKVTNAVEEFKRDFGTQFPEDYEVSLLMIKR